VIFRPFEGQEIDLLSQNGGALHVSTQENGAARLIIPVGEVVVLTLGNTPVERQVLIEFTDARPQLQLPGDFEAR
jgi:hypothetical protein